jgi:4-hydroxy-2-oxoheptanedioate aldolase
LQEIPDSPELIEFLGSVGFDYIIVDGEHAGVSARLSGHLVRAADTVGMTALARVPAVDSGLILGYLEQGVQGIILAHCRSAKDARALVSAVKYPPLGSRGLSRGTRAAGFGFASTAVEHVETANRETMCFGLIEDPDAVPHVTEMLLVEGFDGCYLGAGDLSLSMGVDVYAAGSRHPEVVSRMDAVSRATLDAGKLLMAPAGSGEVAFDLIQRGVQLVVLQVREFLANASVDYLSRADGRNRGN